ncbi:MAG: hypothetical protein AAGC95_17760 [Pseudomonadota bacterium]
MSASQSILPKEHGVVALCEEVRLARGRAHEVQGAGADIFALMTAARMQGPVMWAGRSVDAQTLAPTGLQDFIDPARVIVVSCVTRDEVLWTAEQALRSPGAACVIVDLDEGPDLKTSRRLQIAAEEGGGLGIILIKARAQTSAAQTRWLCEPCSDGDALWVWRLIKDKGGRTGVWRVYQPNDHGRSNNGRSNCAPGLVLMAAASAA